MITAALVVTVALYVDEPGVKVAVITCPSSTPVVVRLIVPPAADSVIFNADPQLLVTFVMLGASLSTS